MWVARIWNWGVFIGIYMVPDLPLQILVVVYHMSLCCKAHTLGVYGKKGGKSTPAALRLTFENSSMGFFSIDIYV